MADMFDDLLPLEEQGPHTCWDDGLLCAYTPMPEGKTLPMVVRTNGAPLLVLIHHFPAQQCSRCGNEAFDGALAAAITRELEARYQRGEQLPAEMEFSPSLAA